MNIIEARGLQKKYGDSLAVKGVSFSIKEGEFFGFLGPNGAGKTTTINMLTGLARLTAGNISFAGSDYTHNIKDAQHLMGIVPDESNLYDEMNGFENLSFSGALYGMPRDKREKKAQELLKQFNLDHTGKKPFKTYSRGMKRKLTIAAAIIHSPPILFLDEPTTGIDVASAREIRKLLLDLNKDGCTIFLTTHYLEEAERLCHRIAFIVEGEIVRTGNQEELMNIVHKEQAVQITCKEEIPDLRAQMQKSFPHLELEAKNQKSVKIISPSHIRLMPLLKLFEEMGLTVLEARLEKPSLEDIFVKITGLDKREAIRESEVGER